MKRLFVLLLLSLVTFALQTNPEVEAAVKADEAAALSQGAAPEVRAKGAAAAAAPKPPVYPGARHLPLFVPSPYVKGAYIANPLNPANDPAMALWASPVLR